MSNKRNKSAYTETYPDETSDIQGSEFIDQILSMDEFGYLEEDEDLTLVLPEFEKPWRGMKHERDMGENWFPVAGMERVAIPAARFKTAEQARKYFTSKYTVICYANSARYWCCVVRPATSNAQTDNNTTSTKGNKESK